MPQVEHEGVTYLLEMREHPLYGAGCDLFMLGADGKRPKYPIAFLPAPDEAAAVKATEQWLKLAMVEDEKEAKKAAAKAKGAGTAQPEPEAGD